MPLTPDQIQDLNNLISSEGTLFAIIKNYGGLTPGTKMMLLEKATTQDPDYFLESLDKVYMPDPTDSRNLQFIYALYFINALCFNTKVDMDETTLSQRYGHEADENADDFLITIQNIVSHNISKLSNGIDAATIEQQKEERRATEQTIARNTEWRDELEVPLHLRMAENLPEFEESDIEEEEEPNRYEFFAQEEQAEPKPEPDNLDLFQEKEEKRDKNP